MDSRKIEVKGQTLVVPDALQVLQGGRVVARVVAEYDLSDVAPEYFPFIEPHLLHRQRVLVPTWSRMRRDDAIFKNYRRRKEEYGALPWLRRLFTRRPWSTDAANEPDPVLDP